MCRTGMCRFGIGNWIFLLLALHLFTYAQGGDDLQDYGVRFIAEPADTVAVAGDPALLQCAASPGARVTWRYSADGAPGPDHELKDDMNRRQLSNGSLLIENMSGARAGRYQCVAAAAAGRIVSRVALVMVAEVPEFLPGPSTVHAVEGAPAILPCPLKAPPRAALRVRTDPPARRVPHKGVQPPTILLNITWTVGGVPVPGGPERALLAGGALELDPARPNAAGQYVCRVALAQRPEDYRLSPAVTLQVAEAPAGDAPPRLVAAPSSLTVIEGASATFPCAAAGSPRPEVVWLHDGVAIDLSELDSRYRVDGSSSLTLSGARPADAGAYTCRALNSIDAADHTAALTVLSPPRVSTGDPPGAAVAVTWERADVTLRCSVRGRPTPAVTWLKDGELLTPNQRDLALVDGSSLRIAGVLRVDAGMFQCAATSPAGSALGAVRLRLARPPAPTPRPLPQEILNSLLSTNDQQTTETDSQQNLETDFLGETSSAYIDKDVEYNDYEEGKREYDLFHAAKGGEELPTNGSVVSAPVNLKPVIVKHRFVTLSWEPPALALQPLTGYLLMYRVNGSERVQVWRGGPSRREATVGGLSPRTAYKLAAAATTADAMSPLTPVLEITTGEEELTHGPPLELRGEPAGPHALRLTWAPPAPGGLGAEAPDKYSVHYTEIDSGREQVLWVEADPLSPTVTAVVGGLRAGALYTARVAAAGGAGASLRLRTPAAPPAMPPHNVTVVVTGATSLLVQWSPPPPRSLGGPLTGYKVRYRAAPSTPAGARRRADALTTPADVKRADLTELEPDVMYQVRVCAMNANGSGPFSEWVGARTLAPAPPTDAHVPPQPPPLTTRAGRDWISVWWSPGPGAGGRGWSLGWGLGVPDEASADLPAHARSHLVRNLEPNSEYVISLRASNALGLGPPVYATVRTRAAADGDEDEVEEEEEDDEEEAEEEPLIPPVGLKVIMLSGTTAVVYWTDPTLPKGQSASDGRRYVVRWSGGGRARALNASDPNAMLDDLRPYTKYEFAVKLIKGGRESAWSLLATNTTLEALPGPPRDVRAAPPSPPAAPARAIDLSWAPPNKANGVITGYVVMFSAGGAEEWATLPVAGDRTRARVDRLRPRTTYSFKVQARNSKGLGPFSAPVQLTTAQDTGGGGGLAAATSAWLWASAGGAVCVLALAAALALSLCCRRQRPTMETDTSTYQKSSASAAIKPPDLWIHHDQMELKHLDKSLHSSNMSAGSAEGGLVASSLTLSRPAEYEPARQRQLAPTYVECGRASASSAETAPAHRDRCDTCLYTSMTGMGVNTMPTMNTMSSLGLGLGGMGGMGTMGGMGAMGGMGPGCSATCDRRHQRGLHEQLGGSSLASPHASLASLQPLHAPPLCAPPCAGIGGGVVSAGGDIYASAARERGHYVAYEPLGHYTHRDSLSSETGPGGPGPPVGPGGHVGPGGSLPRACAPLHSFSDTSEHSTPTHNTRAGSVRESSPYKKSASSSPGHGTNRLHLGGSVAAHPGELEPLSPARSAERLQREMVNLEGLMKDLSAITHHQFHC